MKDGSYPIADAEDLSNAIHAVGRGGADHDSIRKHIMARAKALGLSSKIPDNWNGDGSMQSNAWDGAETLPSQGVEDALARYLESHTRVEVKSEPPTYHPESRDSFFADLYHRQRGDVGAMQRLDRNQAEQRANPNTTLGTGGEFAPPLWVIEKFQTPARAGRVLGDLVNHLVLPPGISSINWPIITTGADAEIQPGQPDPVTSVDQVTSSAVNTSVVTIAGESDASQQLLDLTPSPGYDGIVYTDLSRAYNAALEVQLLTGSGINGQLTGVQNVTGRQTDVSGGAASTSVSVTYADIGKAIATVGNGRKLPVTHLLMTPRRWAYVASQVDDSHRPIETPSGPHPDQAVPAGGVIPVGRILGKLVYEDGAIPAGSSNDVIVVLRPEDLFLYESTPKFAVDQGVTSGTLQVRLQLRRYCSFQIPYPSGICVITGLTQPTGY